MIEVFDNFLPNEYFEELQSKIFGFSQPWYYLNNITFPDKKGDCLGEYGFNYWIVSKGGLLGDDPTSKMVYNLLMKMRKVSPYKNIYRSRLDLTLYTGESKRGDIHVDQSNPFFPHYATIFYVNDSDGNTVIYNERYDGEDGDYSSKVIQEKGLEEKLTIQQEIEPKANRMVAFDGLYIHTGSVPAKHNTRVILNSNFS